MRVPSASFNGEIRSMRFDEMQPENNKSVPAAIAAGASFGRSFIFRFRPIEQTESLCYSLFAQDSKIAS